ALPCSPWSAAFPPRSPSALPGFRSSASPVLCRCTTPRRRSSGAYSSSPSPIGPCPADHGRLRGLSVLAREVSIHAGGLRLRRACVAFALARPAVWPSGQFDAVGALFGDFGAPIFGFPRLHMPLSNASSPALRPSSHGSGSGWFATPFLYDSFIHNSTPVY